MNKEVNQEGYNKESIPIPDQLNIIINTSIPGFQKIEYRPSMTIKDIEDKNIIFNPLIKLDKSVISKIPKEYQIKEFFNKGLFQSLINHLNKQPAASLLQATRQGYIDNNIKVILDIIFPVNSVIYIDKKPYAIADVRWTTGDWKIDVKRKKEEIDINKIKNIYLRNQLIDEDLIIGEQQLNKIPSSILVGNNYDGPPPLVNSPNVIKPEESPQTEPKPSTLTITEKPSTTTDKLLTITDKPSTTTIIKKPSIKTITDKPSIKTITDKPSTTIIEKPVTKTIVPTLPETKTIEPPPPVNPKIFDPSISDSRVEEISPEEETLFDEFKQYLKTNTNLTSFFKKYFKQESYFSMIKKIYSNMPNNLKIIIDKFYAETTGYVKKITNSGISQTYYNHSCDNVSIIKANSDGDCFFQSVSDGINIYNYENQSNKIIYGNYGKTQLFTIALMRDIVYKYIKSLDDEVLTHMFLVSESYLEELNDKFKEVIDSNKVNLGRDMNPEEYKIELDNIYHMYPNFLVYKPQSVPIQIDDYDKPFKIIKKSQLEEYIKSKDYWANDIALDAVCSLLKICIITVEKYIIQDKHGKNSNRLKALITNYDKIKNECSKKIMFLLLNNNHFELIRFKYINRNIDGTLINKWYSIFTPNLVPPLHILFLLYGTIYVNLTEDLKQNFSIYKSVMENIEFSIKKFISLNQIKNIEEFENIFYNYFRNSFQSKPILLKSLLNMNISDKIVPKLKTDIDGGAPPYNYPRPPYNYQQPPYNYPRPPYNYQQPPYNYPRPPYNYQQPSQYMPNRSQEIKFSKIAYVITIDMELYPGTNLTPEQLKEASCNSKYNAIRKAYSEFIGRPYLIPPAYNRTKKNDINQSKSENMKTIKNMKTRKNKN
jgi:hypothetical protein